MKQYSLLFQVVLIVIFLIVNTNPIFCQKIDTLFMDSLLQDNMLIEGDILVSKDFFDSDACYETNFWPGGIVPFEFNPTLIQAQEDSIILAMAEWEAVANVNFVPRNGESDYVHIFSTVYSDSSNFSEVGRQGGDQYIGIFSWGSRFIMAHELCHTLGFWHEQSRTNRDNYVQINLDCILDHKEHNFDKHSGAGHYGPYDFVSVMHYGAWAFYDFDDPNCNEPFSITVRPPYEVYQDSIGQRRYLSYIDRITMSFVYPGDDWRFVDVTNDGAQSGSFLEPWQQFAVGTLLIPEGGTLWIQPGTYTATLGTFTKAMTIKAPLGGVVIQ